MYFLRWQYFKFNIRHMLHSITCNGSLIQTFLTEYGKKNFLWFKEISWLLFFCEFKKWMSVQSHKYRCNLININIFFNLMKKLSSFEVIKLNKLFLKFLLVLYLNWINIFFNQINNVEEIISFIQKRPKRWFLKNK